jgi:hypothetical protein
MPKFKSIKSALNYFEKSKAASMKDVAKCIEDIMKEEIQEQVYDAYKPQDYVRTGEFIESVKATDITKDRVEVTWRDSGDWTSYAGDHMYVIHGHEMGKVYGVGGYRPITNLVDVSKRRVKKEAPDELIKSLRSKGIKVSRK